MSILELRDLKKHFGGVQAIKGVSLSVKEGDCLGLLGDNGAGKSTLIKIISGNFSPSSGSMFVDGKQVHFSGPLDARDAGIETVYQDLALCENLTAAENVFLGREEVSGLWPFRWLAKSNMRARTQELLARLKSDTPVDGLIKNFSGGQRQAVAISRTLLSKPKIVLLDEPLAAISVKQVREVLRLIEELNKSGITVILISHRMSDIFSVCNRIVVMRQGLLVGDKPTVETTPEEITGLITGAVNEAFAA